MGSGVWATRGSAASKRIASISENERALLERACIALHFQKIADHLVTALGEHALGVELHALDGQRAMAQAHDDGGSSFAGAVDLGSAGGDGERVRKRIFGDDERVIAGAGERRGQRFEDALAVVGDGAGFAVHELMGTNDLAAEGFADGLVAETDAEDGSLSGHVADERNENARLAGSARAGREQDAIGMESFHFFNGELVVAANDDVGTQFAKVLDEVVSEGVVVVEDEDHVDSSVAGNARTTRVAQGYRKKVSANLELDVRELVV